MSLSLWMRLSCVLALLGASLYSSANAPGLALADREVHESGEGCLLLLTDLERVCRMEVSSESSERA